jgi:hypothetical protein
VVSVVGPFAASRIIVTVGTLPTGRGGGSGVGVAAPGTPGCAATTIGGPT